MPTRRGAALGLAAVALAQPALGQGRLETEFSDLEQRSGGLVGVVALDTGGRRRLAHRADQRFPMCSTFKVLAVGSLLRDVDRGGDDLARRITYGRGDLITYSPETERRLAEGMTLAALCEAAITLSDNTAANLILQAIGGPSAVTAFARGIGDPVTRLDRTEPTLNESTPGDPRDTTTPAAMAGDLRTVLLGHTLSPPSRNRLIAWMLACKTGEGGLEAGLPAGWKIAQKTGSGSRGSTNDIGILWPPGRAPIVVAAYTTGSARPLTERNAVLAQVGRIVAASL